MSRDQRSFLFREDGGKNITGFLAENLRLLLRNFMIIVNDSQSMVWKKVFITRVTNSFEICDDYTRLLHSLLSFH